MKRERKSGLVVVGGLIHRKEKDTMNGKEKGKKKEIERKKSEETDRDRKRVR